METNGKTDTTAILDIAYPHVEQALSNKNNVNTYKKFMADILQSGKRHDILFSSIPAMILYSTTDVNGWFKSTNIDKSIISSAIKQTYYYKISNFNPRYAKDESTVAILCAIRYFLLHKMEGELNLALVNLAISGKFYPSVFYGKFKYKPAPHIMEYVVNQLMSPRYDLVRTGSVIGALKSITGTWIDTYKSDRFKEFTDYDVQYVIQQLHSRLVLFMKNISDLFYQVHDDKGVFITYDSDNVTEDDYHLADNDTMRISRIVDNAVDEIVTKNIDYVMTKRSSNNLVSHNELNNIIESLVNNRDNIPLIKEFITILVTLYFQNYPNNRSVKDISFISFSIRPTPNTKDPYALRKREITDLMLINNAANFARRRNRAATESAYYKAFNAYFALMIQKANQ